MANADDKPLLVKDYKADQLRLVEGLTVDLGKAHSASAEALALALTEQATHFAAIIEEMEGVLEKRFADLEDVASAPDGADAGPDRGSIVARKRRDKGEAMLPVGSTVLFRPHDAIGSHVVWAALICGGRVLREGYPAIYTLWVLEPRKARWEENIKEGDAAGTFKVM